VTAEQPQRLCTCQFKTCLRFTFRSLFRTSKRSSLHCFCYLFYCFAMQSFREVRDASTFNLQTQVARHKIPSLSVVSYMVTYYRETSSGRSENVSKSRTIGVLKLICIKRTGQVGLQVVCPQALSLFCHELVFFERESGPEAGSEPASLRTTSDSRK